MTDTDLLIIGVFFVGYVCIALEVFLVPGFGVPGVVGGLAMVAAATLAWLHHGPLWGLIVAFVAAAVTTLTVVAFFRSRSARKLVLSDSMGGAEAHGTREPPAIGSRGIALTPLRPAGTVQLDDAPIDVVTDGIYVERGQPVEIIENEGGRIVVTASPETKDG